MAEQADPALPNLLDACRRVAVHIDARAPIRIDCRQDTDSLVRASDVNLKPNPAGPPRAG